MRWVLIFVAFLSVAAAITAPLSSEAKAISGVRSVHGGTMPRTAGLPLACPTGRKNSHIGTLRPNSKPRGQSKSRPCRAIKPVDAAGSSRRTPVDLHLAPHGVGDLFGVGAFTAQRGQSDSRALVDRTVQLGAQWVREEFTASQLHTGTRAPYSWTSYDRVVEQERRGGLHVLGLLDYSNTWSFRDHETMPQAAIGRLASDFSLYAYAVARHYRKTIQYWEVWNEPNLAQFWSPAPSPSAYAILLSEASQAIKRANPSARIVLAGTSGIDLDFIRKVAARTNQFDVIAVHPYRNLPETGLLRAVHDLRGLHKAVWISEIGWPAGSGCDACTGEVDQARYLVRFYTLAAAAGVQRVFWYDLRDDPHSTSSPEAHFGLLRRNLSLKPAFVEYEFLSHVLAGSRYIESRRIGRAWDLPVHLRATWRIHGNTLGCRHYHPPRDTPLAASTRVLHRFARTDSRRVDARS